MHFDYYSAIRLLQRHCRVFSWRKCEKSWEFRVLFGCLCISIACGVMIGPDVPVRLCISIACGVMIGPDVPVRTLRSMINYVLITMYYLMSRDSRTRN
jgi:hypothetical protein